MSLERDTMNYQDDDEHEPHHREREREEEFEQRPLLAFMG